jgi:hypothetical protein
MKVPRAREIGRELERMGFVNFGKKAYKQTENNCFEIACYLADKFDYQHPKSRGEVRNILFDLRAEQLGWQQFPLNKPTEACLVVRTPDNINDAHIVFEFWGKEYNYGPTTRKGFPIERRIYLRKN